MEELTLAPDRVSFNIPVNDDLRKRFDDYIASTGLNHALIVNRLFDGALRKFLDNYAPIKYPYLPEKQ